MQFTRTAPPRFVSIYILYPMQYQKSVKTAQPAFDEGSALFSFPHALVVTVDGLPNDLFDVDTRRVAREVSKTPQIIGL